MNGRNIHYVDFNHTLVGGTLKVTWIKRSYLITGII
jgi:hypothetical protein